LESRKGDA